MGSVISGAVPQQRNLAKRHGGEVDVKTYCRIYRYRPWDLEPRLVCAGSEDWAPCPDFERCSANKPRTPAPLAEMEKEDQANEQREKHDSGRGCDS
jgi:hypothetical protein